MNFYKEINKNIFRTYLYMLLYIFIITAFGWSLAGYFGNSDILFVAFFFSLFMNFLGYFYSDKLAIASCGAFLADEKEYERIHEMVENLAIVAHLPKPKIYIIPDESMNAFATGRNKNHATIALTSGIIKKLNKSELEGVIAHELAHIGNYDILLSSLIVVLIGVLTFASDIALRNSFFGRNRDRDDDGENRIIFLIQFIFIILAPFIAILVQLAVSRKREFLADATAIKITRYPEGLANALRKLSHDEIPLNRYSKATAHLYIEEPLKEGGRGFNFINRLFATHPPIEERIKRLVG